MTSNRLAEVAPLVVREGRLLAYRLLDVADEIDLPAVEARLQTGATRRGALTGEGARSLVISAPPLELALGRATVGLHRSGSRLEAEVSAHLFAYGAVSFCFDLPIVPGTNLPSLIPLCDEIFDSPELDELARERLGPLLARIGVAARGRLDWNGIETYTVIFVRAFDGQPLASEVLASPALASLIVGEPQSRRLSPIQRQDVLEHAHSYFEDDLVVIDWDSAFVLEPSGSRDIPDILELATSQLLELRYYDGLFDAELARVHREFSRARRRNPIAGLVRSPWVELGRGVVRRLVELTEFTERVDNALKVIGDFYLARVYESAVRRFRIRAWQSSVDAKQALLAQAYGLVRGEIDARRSTVLELVVIALIVVEVVLAVVRR
jgi:hypothetical protein